MLKRYPVIGCAALCLLLSACSPREQQEINQKADQIAQTATAVTKAVASKAADAAVSVANNVKALANYSTVLLPSNVDQYRQAMMNYAQVGGAYPFDTTKFVPVTVPENIAHDIKAKMQFAIDQVIGSAHMAGGQITEFTIQKHIAYIRLAMEDNGWAGVSATLEMIRPLITKNLLVYPTIHHVVWE